MSLLVVGLSHRTAPLALIERALIPADSLADVLAVLMASPHVAEAMALSTCNRVELYAEVDRFHGGVSALSDLLARQTGQDPTELGSHLYVHYEDAAVEHVFAVAAGLDSMVIGEAQILGQFRLAYAAAQRFGTTGPRLHELAQNALRVGKRVHTATRIDATGASLVSVGLSLAEPVLGGLAGRPAVVCGAGSMAALAVATLRRFGIDDVRIINRTRARAELLASNVDASVIDFDDLESALSDVDILVSTTGAAGIVAAADVVGRAMERRSGRALFVLDLALPRDVDPRAAGIEGVTLVDIETLGAMLGTAEVTAEVSAAQLLVAEEVARFRAGQQATGVGPTVAALRSRAAALVEVELARLAGRLPELDGAARAEVEIALRRVVAALLHTPTVRVKELATAPGGEAYALALRELFELDPQAADVVARGASVVAEQRA